MNQNKITSFGNQEKIKLKDVWWKLLLSSKNPYALYASPEWFDTVHKLKPSSYVLGISETTDGEVKSIIPFEINDREIIFSAGRTTFLKFGFLSALAMGGEPLGSISAMNYDDIFQKLFEKIPKLDAIFFKCLQVTEPFLNELKIIGEISRRYVHFVERDANKFIFIKFGDSFEEYLSKFKKKERYNLKRQYQMALKTSNNNLRLERITDISQIEFFVKSGKYIFKNSWKSDADESKYIFSDEKTTFYKHLAAKNLFRSYLLIAENEPWAFVLGFQHQNIFHYSNIAFNNKFAKLSPGTVLFYKMMEDLFSRDKPDILNFGIGDSQYKRRFGTDSFVSADIFLFKRTTKILFISFIFKSLIKLKRISKKILRR